MGLRPFGGERGLGAYLKCLLAAVDCAFGVLSQTAGEPVRIRKSQTVHCAGPFLRKCLLCVDSKRLKVMIDRLLDIVGPLAANMCRVGLGRLKLVCAHLVGNSSHV